MFNIRVMAPTTYQELISAITYAPTTISQFIPAALIETYGYTCLQIIEIAWYFVSQINPSLASITDPSDTSSIMFSPMSDAFHTTIYDDVDMLTLLESAAENNFM